MNATFPHAVGEVVGEGPDYRKYELRMSVWAPLRVELTNRYERDTHHDVKPAGIALILDNDHRNDIDIDPKCCRYYTKGTQSAMSLIFGALAVVIGHICCRYWTWSC